MERRAEINFSLTVCLSAALHLFLLVLWIIPAYHLGMFASGFRNGTRGESLIGRDVIVNINQDDVVKETAATLLSDRDSSGRGFLTRELGDTFLNNSRVFSMPTKRTGGSGEGYASAKGRSALSGSFAEAARKAVSGNNDDVFPISIELVFQRGQSSEEGGSSEIFSDWARVPDRKGINRKNAIFITNDGSFSFDTVKFKHFEYFNRMKNKIATNWFPDSVGNSFRWGGVNSRTGGYVPGYSRVRMVSSQDVKLYFVLNRAGEVLNVVVVESGGSRALEETCRNAVIGAHEFGPVPEDIPGKEVVIPFIFGYYTD